MLAAVRFTDREEGLACPAAEETRDGEESGGAAGAELRRDAEEPEDACGHHRSGRREEGCGRAQLRRAVQLEGSLLLLDRRVHGRLDRQQGVERDRLTGLGRGGAERRAHLRRRALDGPQERVVSPVGVEPCERLASGAGAGSTCPCGVAALEPGLRAPDLRASAQEGTTRPGSASAPVVAVVSSRNASSSAASSRASSESKGRRT